MLLVTACDTPALPGSFWFLSGLCLGLVGAPGSPLTTTAPSWQHRLCLGQDHLADHCGLHESRLSGMANQRGWGTAWRPQGGPRTSGTWPSLCVPSLPFLTPTSMFSGAVLCDGCCGEGLKRVQMHHHTFCPPRPLSSWGGRL